MRIAHPARFLCSSLTFLSSQSTPLLPVKTLTAATTVRLSMPEAENVVSAAIPASSADAADDEDAKYGFTRTEMNQLSLSGSVDPYDRHLFLCFKDPSSWLPRVEEDPLLPKLLASSIKSRKKDITTKTKVTVCEAGDGTDFENGDVLVFPEMIRFKGLTEETVDAFVDDVVVNGKPWSGGIKEPVSGSYVFVCAHGSRDKRCGVCGPVLIEKLKEGVEARGLKDQVFVRACSHVGGHKYAGNLIIYSPDMEGKTMGHWYGYVTPDDVPELLDEHIGKGVVIERIWRGQMGPSTKEVEKMDEQKLPNGDDVKKSQKDVESNGEASKDNVASCCQGANGISCCRIRDGNFEASEEKKVEDGKKGMRKLSCWVSSLDRSEVYAAAAVVGAVGTIAVAYSIYKRSG